MKEQPDIQVPVSGEPAEERVATINHHLLTNDFQKMLITEVGKSRRESIENPALTDDDLRERFTAEAGKILREEDHIFTDDEVREAVREMISATHTELALASDLCWALITLRQSDKHELRLALACELRQLLELKNDEDEGEEWKNAG